IRRDSLQMLRAALLKADRKPVALARHFFHRAAEQHSAAFAELRPEAAMHLHGKAMAMRVPKRAEVSQEARLLLARQSLPDILDRGTQAVDDRLPRGAAAFGHFAGNAY